MIRILVASPDPELAARARTLLREAEDVATVGTVSDATGVTKALTTDESTHDDVLVLHEDLGPLPVLDLARDLNQRFPQVGVVLLARDPSVELMSAAMSAGVRAVVRLPLTLSELQTGVLQANEWAQTVQSRLAAGRDGPARTARGEVIALAGSKGGVGTTTVAVQLALEIQRRDPERTVCLVDLDLQTGDLRAYLDVSHQRSITDLVDVASELTTNHLLEAMFHHGSGLYVLLPPGEGEDAEDLDDTTTARILGGIRARYDTVILDCGSVLSGASAVGVELADTVVLTCRPDVVSLRGANRMLRLWRRLSIRDEGVRALVNGASRDRQVQPSLVARVVECPVLETVIPDRALDVEAASNTGDPSRLEGAVRGAIEALATELLEGREPAAQPDEAPLDDQGLAERVTSDAGSMSAEFSGLILPLAFVVLAVWQFVLTGYTVILANQAATSGAQMLAIEGREVIGCDDHDDEPGDGCDDDCDGAEADPITTAACGAMHGHWARELEVTVPSDADRVDVTVTAPLLIPGLRSPWEVTSSAGAVIEPGALAPLTDEVSP